MAGRTADGCFFLRASGAMTSTFDTGACTRQGHRAAGTAGRQARSPCYSHGTGRRRRASYRSAGHGKVAGLSEKAVEGWIEEAEAHEV
jgi:hypothetical protein